MHKKHWLALATLLGVLISLYSCTYTCDGFDFSNRTMIAFREGETMKYLNADSDAMEFTVVYFYGDSPSSFKGLSMEPLECSRAHYIAVSNRMFLREEIWEADFVVNFNEESTYRVRNPHTSYVIDGDMKVSTRYDKEIDGIVYERVWEVEDLSGERKIDKFTKATNAGVLSFHIKETDTIWEQVLIGPPAP